MNSIIDTALIRRAIEKNGITFDGKKRPDAEKVKAAYQTIKQDAYVFLRMSRKFNYRNSEPIDFSRRKYVKKIRKGCSGFFHPDLMNAR